MHLLSELQVMMSKKPLTKLRANGGAHLNHFEEHEYLQQYGLFCMIMHHLRIV